jgi:hypothetical protein
MNVYDVKKNILVTEQKHMFHNNDFRGVVNKFDEIDANIIENCPPARFDSERFKFRAKTREWNNFSPVFKINIDIDGESKTTGIGIDEQCAKIGDSFYHFEMSTEQQKCLMKQIPLIRNQELTNASDGVYTWFIFTDKQGDLQFVSKKVLTVQEITTKHANIVSSLLGELQTIHYAGEFMKIDDNIEINFLSGTYMQGQFEQFKDSERLDEIKNDAVVFLNDAFNGSLLFTNQTVMDTFITTENILYTRENIKLLLDCGVSIKRFEKAGFCGKYDRRIARRVSAEQNHEVQVRMWKSIKSNNKGDEPVFNYVPQETPHVVVTLDNLDPIAFPITRRVSSRNKKRVKLF